MPQPDGVTRLKALGIDRVAFVPAGDNPEAHLLLWKADPATTWLETVIKRTFTRDKRIELAKSGAAIPVKNSDGEVIDGRYPIETVADLKNAMQAIGRVAEGDRSQVVAHIRKRAKALDATDQLTETFKEGSMTDVRKAPSLTSSRLKRLLGIRDELDSLLVETGGDKGEAVSDATKELLDSVPEEQREAVEKAITEAEDRAKAAEDALAAEKEKVTEPVPTPDPAEDLAKAMAELPEPLRKVFEENQKTATEALDKVKAAETALEKAAEEKRTDDAIAKVRELKNLPVKPEELGPKLAEIRKTSPEVADEVERVLGSVNATASEILRTIGKQDGDVTAEAETKLHALAKTIAERDGIPESVAFTKALETEEGKDLHRQAEAEKEEANTR